MKENEKAFGEPMVHQLEEVPEEILLQWAEEEIAKQEYFDSLNAEIDFSQLEAVNQMFN